MDLSQNFSRYRGPLGGLSNITEVGRYDYVTGADLNGNFKL
jgi:hypothetical protein